MPAASASPSRGSVPPASSSSKTSAPGCVSQRMPRAGELEACIVRDAREREPKILGEARGRGAHVGTRERGDGENHARQRVADARRQSRVNYNLLALDLGLEDLQAIAHRNDR